MLSAKQDTIADLEANVGQRIKVRTIRLRINLGIRSSPPESQFDKALDSCSLVPCRTTCPPNRMDPPTLMCRCRLPPAQIRNRKRRSDIHCLRRLRNAFYSFFSCGGTQKK
eukprot:72154-Amphidinium_carterae.1